MITVLRSGHRCGLSPPWPHQPAHDCRDGPGADALRAQWVDSRSRPAWWARLSHTQRGAMEWPLPQRSMGAGVREAGGKVPSCLELGLGSPPLHKGGALQVSTKVDRVINGPGYGRGQRETTALYRLSTNPPVLNPSCIHTLRETCGLWSSDRHFHVILSFSPLQV